MHEEAESTMLFDIMVDSVDFGITADSNRSFQEWFPP